MLPYQRDGEQPGFIVGLDYLDLIPTDIIDKSEPISVAYQSPENLKELPTLKESSTINGINTYIYNTTGNCTTLGLHEKRKQSGLSDNSWTYICDINPQLKEHEIVRHVLHPITGKCIATICKNNTIIFDHHRKYPNGIEECKEFDLNGRKLEGAASTAPLLINFFDCLYNPAFAEDKEIQSLKKAWEENDFDLVTNHHDADSICSLIAASLIAQISKVNNNETAQEKEKRDFKRNLLERLALGALDADHYGGHMFRLGEMNDPSGNFNLNDSTDLIIAKIIGLMEFTGSKERLPFLLKINEIITKAESFKEIDQLLLEFSKQLEGLYKKVNDTKALVDTVQFIGEPEGVMLGYVLIDQGRPATTPETRYDGTFLQGLINARLRENNKILPNAYVFLKEKTPGRNEIVLRVNDPEGKPTLNLNDPGIAFELLMNLGVGGRDKAGSNTRDQRIVGHLNVPASILPRGLQVPSDPLYDLTAGTQELIKYITMIFQRHLLNEGFKESDPWSFALEVLEKEGKIAQPYSTSFERIETNRHRGNNHAGVLTVSSTGKEQKKFFIKWRETDKEGLGQGFTEYMKETIFAQIRLSLLSQKIGPKKIPAPEISGIFACEKGGILCAGTIHPLGTKETITEGNLADVRDILSYFLSENPLVYEKLGIPKYSPQQYIDKAYQTAYSLYTQMQGLEEPLKSLINPSIIPKISNFIANCGEIGTGIAIDTFKRSNFVRVNGELTIPDLRIMIAPVGHSLGVFFTNFAMFNPQRARYFVDQIAPAKYMPIDISEREILLGILSASLSNALYNLGKYKDTLNDPERPLTEAKIVVSIEMLKYALGISTIEDVEKKAKIVREIFERIKGHENAVEQGMKYGYNPGE